MKKWKISDFVLIGLLAAIDAAVIYGVGMLTAAMVPVMHVFTSSITALIMGTVVLFVVKKIQRFGAMTLLVSLGVAIFTLTGMGSITCLPFVIVIHWNWLWFYASCVLLWRLFSVHFLFR